MELGFQLEIDKSRKFVRVIVEGDVTTESAREFTMAATEFGKKEGIELYLVDGRNSRNVLSTTDNYYYAYREMSTMPLNRTARTAILADKDDSSHDFVETVSQNAGYNVRVFKDEQQAVAWLCEEQ